MDNKQGQIFYVTASKGGSGTTTTALLTALFKDKEEE